MQGVVPVGKLPQTGDEWVNYKITEWREALAITLLSNLFLRYGDEVNLTKPFTPVWRALLLSSNPSPVRVVNTFERDETLYYLSSLESPDMSSECELQLICLSTDDPAKAMDYLKTIISQWVRVKRIYWKPMQGGHLRFTLLGNLTDVGQQAKAHRQILLTVANLVTRPLDDDEYADTYEAYKCREEAQGNLDVGSLSLGQTKTSRRKIQL